MAAVNTSGKAIVAKERQTICESGIVGLCFNKSRTHAAFSPNNHQIYIAKIGGGVQAADCLKWEIVATLEEHGQSVTGIDWSTTDDSKLVSCSQDRTAFVWECQDVGSYTKWVPCLVMLDSGVKRGLMCAKWSTSGQKIIVGSAAKNFAVGSYDAGNAWWWCKVVDKHTSTVTCLAPHPTIDYVVLSGSTDATVNVTSTLMKSIDGKGVTFDKFGTVLQRLEFSAWVNAVEWSPNGHSFAVTTHDSRVHVATSPTDGMFNDFVVQSISLKGLPMRSLTFLSDIALVAGGYDLYPVLFNRDSSASEEGEGAQKGGVWSMVGKWTQQTATKKQSELQLARARFQNEAATGQAAAVELSQTKHKNVIVSVVRYAKDGSTVDENTNADELLFATGSMDGRVEMWSLGDMVPV